MKDKNCDSEMYSGDILQNQFTSYTRKALYLNQIQYKRKRMEQFKAEISSSRMDCISMKASFKFSDIMHRFNDERLNTIMDIISGKDALILKLRVIYGYSYEEIAAFMNMNPITVRVRYSRIVEKTRKLLEDMK